MKFTSVPLLLFISVTVLLGCKDTKATDSLYGMWMMHQVIQNNQDVTAQHNPENDRYIIMHQNSTFETGGQPFGGNTGTYSFNLVEQTLFIDSDAGANDDSRWTVRMSNDTMYWRGVGSEWAENFQLIHVRAAAAK